MFVERRMTVLEGLCPACFEPLEAGESCTCDYHSESDISHLVLRMGSSLAPDSQPDDTYIIGRVLGTGAFGITYLAWRVSTGSKVAIKEYLPREIAGRISNGCTVRPHTPNYRSPFDYGFERFEKEAEALNAFRHPNVVSVLTHFRANDTAYLVMPYYHGEDLGKWMDRNSRMPPATAIEMMLSVLDGLRHVHQTTVDGRRWMHRDVKPDNIFLRSDGAPLLIDFGAARQEVGERSRALTGVLTVEYAPHEQCLGLKSEGPTVDIYACAATLYRVLTGTNPEKSTVRYGCVVEGLADPLISPATLVADLPPSLVSAVLTGLAIQPKDRFQDAGQFQSALKQAKRELQPPEIEPDAPTQPGTEVPTPPVTSSPGLAPALWIPVLLILAVAVAGLGFYVVRLQASLENLRSTTGTPAPIVQLTDVTSTQPPPGPSPRVIELEQRLREKDDALTSQQRELDALKRSMNGNDVSKQLGAELTTVRQQLQDSLRAKRLSDDALAAKQAEVDRLTAQNSAVGQRRPAIAASQGPLASGETQAGCREKAGQILQARGVDVQTNGAGDKMGLRGPIQVALTCQATFWYLVVVGPDGPQASALRTEIAGDFRR
ncbi:MAG: protein kinase [Vicinamibacterales bacterium]